MTYAYSLDQSTIEQWYATLPLQHWVQDTATAGHYEPLTVGNASTFGYYEYDDTAIRPADTSTTTWDRTAPFVGGRFVVTWTERPKTAEELDDDARRAKGVAVGQAVTTLRQWAADARGVTVTNGNNNAVTQTMVNRLGVFFDRFADLIEHQRLDQ